MKLHVLLTLAVITTGVVLVVGRPAQNSPFPRPGQTIYFTAAPRQAEQSWLRPEPGSSRIKTILYPGQSLVYQDRQPGYYLVQAVRPDGSTVEGWVDFNAVSLTPPITPTPKEAP